MKTILVPTDFSEAAQNAAEYAVQFAHEVNAAILLFHAYKLPVSSAPDALIMPPTAAEWHKDNEDLLRIEIARLKRKTKTSVEIKCKAKMGLAADEIREEEKGAEFIVMGMSGMGRVVGSIFGSITTATLKKINTPMIVVPEGVHYRSPERIVLASDLDPLKNIKVLDKLKGLVEQFKSIIFIVNVKKSNEKVTIENDMAEMQLETRLKDVEHVYYYPENEDSAEAIDQFVKTKKADMLAVIPHHYTFIERLFHKSFSKKMIFHTEVPLLLLPDHSA